MGAVSLIKEAFLRSSSEFKNNLYEKQGYKPFTFSLYLPAKTNEAKISETKGYIRLRDEPIQLIFSTSSYEFLMHFCNGMQKIIEYNISIPVRVGQPHLLPQETINVSIKTYYVHAALFHQYDGNRKRTGYAKYEEEHNFNVAVIDHIQARIKKAFPYFPEEELPSITAKWEWGITSNIMHYSDAVKAVRGVFTLAAPPRVQHLFYDEGIGVRTAQGFGMPEHGEYRLRG
jgi:CRISPR-associated endoribonuclease Cas6